MIQLGIRRIKASSEGQCDRPEIERWVGSKHFFLMLK